jgi:RNA recognition motif-containing protein
MAKRLYVGNINYGTTEDKLKEVFGAYGEVTAVNMIIDKLSGRSKGFAFVELAEEEAANSARTALDGQEVDGRKIKVNEAREMGERRPRPNGGFNRNRNNDRRY